MAVDDDVMNSKVSEVVWPWRENASASAAPQRNGIPLGAILRQAGTMSIVGAVLYWGLEHRTMGLAAWALAAVVAVSGLFIPPFFAAIERFGQALGRWVGAILTWSLLAPFYYVVLIPLNLLQRIAGKDPLHRRFPSNEPTHWVSRKPVADAAQYRKQF